MAQRQRIKGGPDVILADPIRGPLEEKQLSEHFSSSIQDREIPDSSKDRPLFKSSREYQKDGGRTGLRTLIESPLEVHVDGSGNFPTRREGNSGGSTGTKTSPSSAENGSGQGSRAPTALAGWSPTSMTTTGSISVGHSPGLMDTSQGSVSKAATDTPSPKYQGDITLSSQSHHDTPSPPRRQSKSVISSNPHDMNGASFQPRSSLYNNVDTTENTNEGGTVDSTVVLRRKQHPRGRGRVGRDGNNILRSALEKHFQDPSDKDLDDYVRYEECFALKIAIYSRNTILNIKQLS